MKKTLIILLLPIVLGFISCEQNDAATSKPKHAVICLPAKTSLEETDLKGPVKRVTERRYTGNNSINIKEYDGAGMLVVDKRINDLYAMTNLYEYDEFNRSVKETSEMHDFENGIKWSNNTYITYSDDEKVSKEFNKFDVLVEEEKTKYEFDSDGRLLSEIIYITKYDSDTHKVDTSYFVEKIAYKYEDDHLKYKVEYENDGDSTCFEYDKYGHWVKTQRNRGFEYTIVAIWDGDVKVKELYYEYGELDGMYTYDSQGREIEDRGYGRTTWNSQYHTTHIFKTTYYSDNEYLYQVFREYVTYNNKTYDIIDSKLKIEEEYRFKLERDAYGNIVKKYRYQGSSKHLYESYEYEYY